MTPAEYERRFIQTANLQSKTLIFVLIPASAGLSVLLYGFRRRFVEYLVLMSHFFAFLLLFPLPYFYGFVQAYKAALHAGFAVTGDMLENSLSLSWALIAAAYAGFALHRAFGGPMVGGDTTGGAARLRLVSVDIDLPTAVIRRDVETHALTRIAPTRTGSIGLRLFDPGREF